MLLLSPTDTICDQLSPIRTPLSDTTAASSGNVNICGKSSNSSARAMHTTACAADAPARAGLPDMCAVHRASAPARPPIAPVDCILNTISWSPDGEGAGALGDGSAGGKGDGCSDG